MPVCSNCHGEDNFYVEDGFYFCNDCDTQSQDILDLQIEAEHLHQPQLQIRPKSHKSLRKEKVHDKGKPWFTHEAFQFIIKQQVDKLIELGVTPKLKEIVFQLWCKYLSKGGIAFTANVTDDTMPGMEPFPRLRDAYPGTDEDPIMVDAKMKRGKRRRRASSGSVTESILSTSGKSTTPESEVDLVSRENMEGDNFSDIELSDDEDSEIESIGSIDSRNRIRFINRMSMDLTVSFIYLALLWLREPVLLCDLLRWIREGYLPYIGVGKILPKHMKFSFTDSETFSSSTVPSNLNIRCKVGKLAKYIDLNEFPPVYINKMISRFILDLNLPAEFHGYISNLLDKPYLEFEVKKGKLQTLISYEGIAMAYIIVTLKMMFGVDDVTEHEISRQADKLQNEIKTNVTLFTWDRWTNALRTRQRKHVSSGVPKSLSGLSKLHDISRHLKHYQDVTSKSRAVDISFTEKRRIYQEVNRRELQRPFQVLRNNEDGNSKDLPRQEPTSFSFIRPSAGGVSQEAMFADDDNNDDVRERNIQMKGDDVEDLQTDFSLHTVEYITNVKEFMELHCNHGDMETMDVPQGVSDDDCSNGDHIKAGYRFTTAHENYVVYPDFKSNKGKLAEAGFLNEQDEFHYSYAWLLDVCSDLLETNKNDLHGQVVNVEFLIGIRKESFHGASFRFGKGKSRAK